MPIVRGACFCLLLGLSFSSLAWWGGAPYQPYPGGYWPGYGYAPYGNNLGYGGSDWNVKGVMNEWGDTHFVIEYHGNIYDDMTGGSRGRPYYGGYPRHGGYGLPYQGFPYGGWR